MKYCLDNLKKDFQKGINGSQRCIIKKYMPEIGSTFTEFLEMMCSEDEWNAEDYYEKGLKKFKKSCLVNNL